MKSRRAKPMREELISCITILICGAGIHRYYMPVSVIAVLGIPLCLWMLVLDVTKGSPEELDREARDERNLMLQDRAAWLCRKLENALWITVWIGISLYTELATISYAIYWIIILRYWLFFFLRWRLNRKY